MLKRQWGKCSDKMPCNSQTFFVSLYLAAQLVICVCLWGESYDCWRELDKWKHFPSDQEQASVTILSISHEIHIRGSKLV